MAKKILLIGDPSDLETPGESNIKLEGEKIRRRYRGIRAGAVSLLLLCTPLHTVWSVGR